MKIDTLYYQNNVTPLKTVEKFFGEAHTTFLLSDNNPEDVYIREGAKVIVREEYYMGSPTLYTIYSDGFSSAGSEENFWSGFIIKDFDGQAQDLLAKNCNEL